MDLDPGADIAKNDGIYSKYFTAFRGNGRHSLKVRVQGKGKMARLGFRRKINHALYIPGYVENGNIQMNPPRPSINDDIETTLEKFSRTASGGSFAVSEVPIGPLPDKFPPCAIFDLEARLENGKIELSWTAPGDDLDQGRATSYQIRMSGNPVHLMANFNTATSIDVSFFIPKVAGSLETIIFALEELALQNEGVTYFAVRTMDKTGNWSETSNIAQVALIIPTTSAPTSSFVPTEPPASSPPSTPITCLPPVSYPSTSSPPPIQLPQSTTVHIPTVVITVSLVVVIICLAISITLCFKQDEA